MAKDSLLFTESHMEKLFRFNMMKKVKGLKSVRGYMGFVNTFLKEYGLVISICRRKSVKTKKGDKYYHHRLVDLALLKW